MDEVAAQQPRPGHRSAQHLFGPDFGLLRAEPQHRLHGVDRGHGRHHRQYRREELVDQRPPATQPLEDLLELRVAPEDVEDAVGHRADGP